MKNVEKILMTNPSTTTKEALEPCPLCRKPLTELTNGLAYCHNLKTDSLSVDDWIAESCPLAQHNVQLPVKVWHALNSRASPAPIVDRIVERCADCGHSEGTDANGRCRFMYVASDPSQMVDTSPSNQCSHYCPRTIGERIARKHLPFTDYDEPLSKAGQQLAADIDSAIRQVREQSIGYARALTGETLGGI